MSENEPATGPETDPVMELRARAEALERQLADVEREARKRVAHAELKAEAIRAGILDLDGLKLIESTDLELTPQGELANGAHVIAQLRQSKPWLFGGGSSSSPANPPPAQPPRTKHATEMTEDEYRIARAAVVKQHW